MTDIDGRPIRDRVRFAYDSARGFCQSLTLFLVNLNDATIDTPFDVDREWDRGLLWNATNVVGRAIELCDDTDQTVLALASQVYLPSDPPITMRNYGVFGSWLSAFTDLAGECIHHTFHDKHGEALPEWAAAQARRPPARSIAYGEWLESVRLCIRNACIRRARARLRLTRMTLDVETWAMRETLFVRLNREEAAIHFAATDGIKLEPRPDPHLKPAGYTITDLKEAAGTELDAPLSKDRWQKIRRASGLPARGTGGTEGNRRFSNRDVRTLADTADRLAHATSDRLRDGEKIARAWRALLPSE